MSQSGDAQEVSVGWGKASVGVGCVYRAPRGRESWGKFPIAGSSSVGLSVLLSVCLSVCPLGCTGEPVPVVVDVVLVYPLLLCK